MLNRDGKILIRALELAESGHHIDCLTIESALVHEGYHEASELLKNESLRRGLRTMCQKHWYPQRGEAANSNNSSGLREAKTR